MLTGSSVGTLWLTRRMKMETKWLAILGVGIFVAMFGALAVSSVAKSNCKAAAIAAHASAEVIELCNRE